VLRRPLPLTVALALVTGVAAWLLVFPPARRVPGTATPYCTVLQVWAETDEAMRRAAQRLRDDDRVREVRDERTQADNHARLTETLRAAGRDDLADAARVESTPASLRVVEAFGVDAAAFAEELRREHRVTLADACEDPGARSD
jgi:hypothetical protein